MIRIAIDLEMHSDGKKNFVTGDIIQTGYTIFDTVSEKILFTGGDYIITNQPLSPFIQSLTGISEEEILKRGVSLDTAYKNMARDFFSFKSDDVIPSNTFNQIVEWGAGDSDLLKKSLIKFYGQNYFNQNWQFSHTSLNLHPIYQFIRIKNNLDHKGGLKVALKKSYLSHESYKDEVAPGKFRQRGRHDARTDSLNTARLYLKLQKEVN